MSRKPPVADQAPTLTSRVASAQSRRPPSARRHLWPRSLRWRLTLMYAGLLAGLLLLLGVVLNTVIGSVLYKTELAAFQEDAGRIVVTSQSRFDTEVRGQVVRTGQTVTCSGSVAFQQAFANTTAAALSASHTGVQSVYLLDRFGSVLTPATASAQVGALGPYITAARLAALQRARATTASGTSSVLAQSSFITTTAGGSHIGVLLVLDRYISAAPCVDATHTHNTSALGIVEVVTAFPRVRATLTAVHLILILAMLGALLIGLLLGAPLIGQALRPLVKMTDTAQRIASGDLNQRVRLPHSGDEVGLLALTFDEMIDRIQRAFAAQQASEERMRQFIADASHELRTPLTSIRGFVDVLLRGAKDDPATVQEVLTATQREAERMSRLVADLLTLARLDAGRPLAIQQVDLVALSGEAVDHARILAGLREVTLRTDGQGHLVIPGDADRLKQVLLILLDNALKYGRPAPAGWVHVQVSRTPELAIVSVADNGDGIPPGDQPHIFDRFYRVERAARQRLMTGPQPAASAQEGATEFAPPPHAEVPLPPATGSGLGLAIAQAIVQAHGGTITLRSQVGAGTTVSVALPLQPQHALTATGAASPAR